MLKSNLENSQAGSSSDDIMNLTSDDRVVLEPGISGNGSRIQSGSQKASNFFHSIGIDSGFGKPEYLTTTIFEENAEDNSAEERDEESIEATNDFEVSFTVKPTHLNNEMINNLCGPALKLILVQNFRVSATQFRF